MKSDFEVKQRMFHRRGGIVWVKMKRDKDESYRTGDRGCEHLATYLWATCCGQFEHRDECSMLVLSSSQRRLPASFQLASRCFDLIGARDRCLVKPWNYQQLRRETIDCVQQRTNVARKALYIGVVVVPWARLASIAARRPSSSFQTQTIAIRRSIFPLLDLYSLRPKLDISTLEGTI